MMDGMDGWDGWVDGMSGSQVKSSQVPAREWPSNLGCTWQSVLRIHLGNEGLAQLNKVLLDHLSDRGQSGGHTFVQLVHTREVRLAA